jgi:hypothetical protein
VQFAFPPSWTGNLSHQGTDETKDNFETLHVEQNGSNKSCLLFDGGPFVFDAFLSFSWRIANFQLHLTGTSNWVSQTQAGFRMGDIIECWGDSCWHTFPLWCQLGQIRPQRCRMASSHWHRRQWPLKVRNNTAPCGQNWRTKWHTEFVHSELFLIPISLLRERWSKLLLGSKVKETHESFDFYFPISVIGLFRQLELHIKNSWNRKVVLLLCNCLAYLIACIHHFVSRELPQVIACT